MPCHRTGCPAIPQEDLPPHRKLFNPTWYSPVPQDALPSCKMLYHPIVCSAIPQDALPSHKILCHPTGCSAIPYDALPSHRMLCHPTGCSAVPQDALPSHRMPCLEGRTPNNAGVDLCCSTQHLYNIYDPIRISYAFYTACTVSVNKLWYKLSLLYFCRIC